MSRGRPSPPSSSYSRSVGAIALLFGVLCIWSLSKWNAVSPELDEAARLGGGILFLSHGECLLVQRQKDHLWLLPGGHFNHTVDLEVFNTAMREATEKLGYLPLHDLHDHILAKWGRRGEREFTVFLASVNSTHKRAYLPRPDVDHGTEAASWFPVEKLPSLAPDLHPVVNYLQDPFHKSKIMTVDALSD